MNYEDNLTPRELEIVDQFPATYSELCDQFGFGKSTARDHISSMERKGTPITWSKVSVGDSEVKEFQITEEQVPIEQNETRKYGSTAKKASKTKRLNNVAENLSKRLDSALNATTPAVSSEPLSSGGDEDVAIHATDDHIGDVLEDDNGNEVFNTETAIEKIRHRVTRTFEIIERQRQAGSNFHTAHYLMGGDIITGSGIYQGQAWEVEKNFNEQIDIAVSVHWDQITRLAEEFEAVQIVCQTGNHGEIRIQGSSEKANGDDIVYRMIDMLARVSDHDNITVVRNHATNYVNFRLRNDVTEDQRRAEKHGFDSIDDLPEKLRTGHQALLRHGKDMKAQSETRAASDDLRGWKLMHGFDIMYAGHYHKQGQDRVMEAPLIRSGSICPTDEFEESISEWSMPMSTVHGVSDDQPKTWSWDIQYEGDKE